MTRVAGPAATVGRQNALHVIQGQYAVSGDPDAVICTLLGSCVACCLRDPVLGIGGMNHFLLPEGQAGSDSLSYGVNAMELLINELLRMGARRDRLEAKLFGGGRLINGISDIGQKNGEFAKRFLENEGIKYVGGSLGGDSARRIEFWPVSGRARQNVVDRAEEVFKTETRVNRAPAPEPAGGLELF